MSHFKHSDCYWFHNVSRRPLRVRRQKARTHGPLHTWWKCTQHICWFLNNDRVFRLCSLFNVMYKHHLFICLFIYLPISIYLFVCLSVYEFIHSFIHLYWSYSYVRYLTFLKWGNPHLLWTHHCMCTAIGFIAHCTFLALKLLHHKLSPPPLLSKRHTLAAMKYL